MSGLSRKSTLAQVLSRGGVGRWRIASMRGHFGYPAIALGALIVACLTAFGAHHALTQAEMRRALAQLAHTSAEQHLAELEREAARARVAQGQMDEAQQIGFGQGQWAIRRMDIHQATMSRATLNDLLSQLTRTPLQLFGADSFELSMKDANGGLFETPAAGNGEQSLSVTLSGTLYFRLRGAP